ncbi:polyphenol oxidase family protein [Methylocystis bryophila]|uniref:Polyphenol oxidase n=1 Tax=Methylocystis bryophila TaxID=655015 RepID=A0A1W6MX71_9HYPH|nr:polyphenol oxidase family protein [Methylocystis bryophila]ARN82188.1 polyphenol oxidase [Methylocystis bryophila]BDV38320.1 laccase domain protein [Methylocystis bryophila]
MTASLQAFEAESLALPGLAHGFFGRSGGVSTGVYASLNGGVGSRDAPERVEENKSRMAQKLGVAAERLLVPYQIHSAEALAVSEPWALEARPRCDGLATRARGLALGVTGADCGMLLFVDAAEGVIGAAHAGWKGALYGVIEATLAAMEGLGARRNQIRIALGPMIDGESYEVGPEFVERFAAEDAGFRRFFKPSPKPGHAMFDLPAFIEMRADQAGVASFENIRVSTYAHEESCFSYRRSVHRGEEDYGRLVSAIALI